MLSKQPELIILPAQSFDVRVFGQALVAKYFKNDSPAHKWEQKLMSEAFGWINTGLIQLIISAHIIFWCDYEFI